MEKELNLKKILNGIQPIEKVWVEKARERTAQLVMPARALGRLHEMAERFCGIQRTLQPSMDRKAVLVLAGDHGVVQEGVSAYPQEVTGAMVQTFLVEGAGINAIARHVGAEVWVIDMGIVADMAPGSLNGGERLKISKMGRGTANFTQGPAMPRGIAEKAILAGFGHAADLFMQGVEVLGTGDMGIGNTTPSAAIGAVVTGASLEVMVGRGTGVDDAGLNRKRAAIEKGIEVNQPVREDGLDILSKVGGFEIGGIAGCVLAGAYYRRPVVIDGFISTAGALVAATLCPVAREYLFAGHRSEEPGHKLMLEHLGLEPVLDLGMRLGEGTGGALAMGVMEGALKVFKEVLTFEEAGITG